MSDKLLKINKLYLDNYRAFEDFTIDFDEQLTVLIAINGKGKTAILDAIAVAFGTFVNATGLANGVVFHREDVRRFKVRETQSNEMEEAYPLVLKANGFIDNDETQWIREFRKPNGATTTKDTKPLVNYGAKIRNIVSHGEGTNLPLISYYGTGRLWAQKRATKNKKKSETSRLSGYIDCLDSFSSYKAFTSWYEYICKSEFEIKMEALEKEHIKLPDNEFSDIRRSLQEAVNQVIQNNSGWQDIVYKQKAKSIVMKNEVGGILSVAQLSDGIRSMIGLVADIAYRAIKLNPHLKNAPKETSGIIMIDEVDMHLHPKWQQTVLTDLTSAFPNIQFIVTTHSSQVLSTVKREQIRLLGDNTVTTPSTHSFGEDSSVLLAELMNVSPLPPLEIVEKRKEYQRLIENKEYESSRAKQLQEELTSNYGENSEFIIQTQMLIRRFEALKKVGK
ncbi:AAA family ATPase [Candidatus Sulfurimonas marisnigri]|uniref:AAA family ATPase n=1 Tax=Candidatus Sulfurimonas marisnigri TaxID=2740405 RepID=A0A7S7LYW3_9BACT|nr:AAA family ATPase [Candidatus Sulfurimonas marisnigri]QOY54010.1 AAA family ATPase [Candidatus Sulfurimonas marisnigri]